MRTFWGILLCLGAVNLPLTRSDSCGWIFDSVVINDTTIDQEIYNFTLDGTSEFKSWKVTQADGNLDFETALTYFQYNVSGDTFYVSTTNDFKNLNNDAYDPDSAKNQLTISFAITLVCDGKSVDSTLMVQIQNTNQNGPEFSQDRFNYSVPLPLMPKIDFSLYGDKIIATDTDFSTKQITFSIDPDHFEVTSSEIGNKTFEAIFSAKHVLQFNESQVYTITATDSGSPAKSSEAKITLNVDPTSSLDIPSFSSPFYTYNYTAGVSPTLIRTSELIAIQTKKSDATFTLSGDNSDQFHLLYSANKIVISLKLGASLPEDVVSPVLITLSCTTDMTVSTIIWITVVKDVPVFTRDYYVGTYNNESNVISWNEPINVTNASTVVVSEDKADLFQFDLKTCELTAKSTLSSSDFDENSNLFLTLIASSASNVQAHTVIAISLPISDKLKIDGTYENGGVTMKKAKSTTAKMTLKVDPDLDIPSFSSSYYTYNYTGGNAPALILTSDKVFIQTNKTSEVKYALSGDYSETFKILYNSDNVQVLLKLGQSLPEDVVSPVILTFSFTTDITVSAVLIISVVNSESVGPSFTEDYYVGTYNIDTNEIIWNEAIIVSSASTVTVSGDKADLFKFNLTTLELKLTSKLSVTDFDENFNMFLTLIASSTSNLKARATVAISLPTSNDFKFDRVYYFGSYIIENEKEFVILEDDIGFINVTDFSDIIIVVDDSYSDNFELNFDKSKWKITVVNPLNATTLDVNSELAILITASKIDDASKSTAIVILKLPAKTEINFTDSYYTAKYIKGSGADLDTVSLDQNIFIEGADSSKVIVTIQPIYNTNFKLEYDEASFSYTINVIRNLDSWTVSAKQLIITITAYIATDTSVSASTVLVLALPESSLSFEDDYYTAKYILDTSSITTVEFTSRSIQVTGAESSEIEFNFKDYDTNFMMDYDDASASYQIKVINNLNSSSLSAKELIITITATDIDTSDSANTMLVLTLPQSSLSFEDDYYTAQYTMDTSTTATVKITSGSINLTGAISSEINFTFKDYDANFKMDYDAASDSYQIKVTKILDLSSFPAKELIITITASKIADTSVSANTVLVLKMPQQSLSFVNDYYTAKYIADTPTTASVEITSGSINLSGANSNEITFTFKDYDSNFKMDYDDASDSYQIMVTNNLDLSYLPAKELIITITAFEIADTSVSANTVLVLTLPQQSLNFVDDYYTAKYTADTSTTASVEITSGSINLTGANSSEIIFTFKDYDTNFNLKYDAAYSSYQIMVIKLLDSSTLSAKELIITVTASMTTDPSVSANTILVLTLPEQSLSFKNNYYNAKYIVDMSSTATVELISENITLPGTESGQIDFTFKDYDSNFKLEYNTGSSSYQIKVIGNLDSNTLTQKELIITINAYEIADPSISATTVLVLTLPEQSLSFKDDYYRANYIVDTSSIATVKLISDNITVAGTESSQIDFTFKDYDTNFKMEYDADSLSYKINVIGNLDLSIFSEKELIIKITAYEIADANVLATTVLVLTLPEQSLSFKDDYYRANYIVDTSFTATVELISENITLPGTESGQIDFTFKDYDTNFKLEYDIASASYKINVIKDLDFNILSAKELILTITAYMITNKNVSANTILVLELPEQPSSLSFEHEYYTATYITNSPSKDAVEITSENIKITGAQSSKLQFSFADYDTNFKLDYDEASSSYKINVIKNLDPTTSSGRELIITITASITCDTSISANAILVLAMPGQASSLSFDHDYYTATYISNISATDYVVFTSENIKLTGTQPSQIEFTFKEYDANFKLVYNDDSSSYQIKVINNLDLSLLSENELTITITASMTTDTSIIANTELVLNLPSFRFHNDFYTNEHVVNTSSNGTVQFSLDSIYLTNAESPRIKFEVQGLKNSSEVN